MIFLPPLLIFLCFCFYCFCNQYFLAWTRHLSSKKSLSLFRYTVAKVIKIFCKKGFFKNQGKIWGALLLLLWAMSPLYFLSYDETVVLPNLFLMESGPYFSIIVCLFFYIFVYSTLSSLFYSYGEQFSSFSSFAFFRKIVLSFSKNMLLCLSLAPYLFSSLWGSQQRAFLELGFRVEFFSYEFDLMILLRTVSFLLFFIFLLYEIPYSIFSSYKDRELLYYKEGLAGLEDIFLFLANFIRLFVLMNLFLFLYSDPDLFSLMGLAPFEGSALLSFFLKFIILFSFLRLVTVAFLRIDFVQSLMNLQGFFFSFALLNLLLTCVAYFYSSLGGH